TRQHGARHKAIKLLYKSVISLGFLKSALWNRNGFGPFTTQPWEAEHNADFNDLRIRLPYNSRAVAIACEAARGKTCQRPARPAHDSGGSACRRADAISEHRREE